MVLSGLVSDLFHSHLTSPNGASECTTLHVISQLIKVRSPSYQRKKNSHLIIKFYKQTRIAKWLTPTRSSTSFLSYI